MHDQTLYTPPSFCFFPHFSGTHDKRKVPGSSWFNGFFFPLNRRDLSNRIHEVANVNEAFSTYTSRRNSSNSAISNANSEPFEIAPHHVKWVDIW